MAEIRNRRRGPDTMVRLITVFSIGSWVVIFFAFFFYQMSHGAGGSYSAVRTSLLDFSSGVVLAKVLLSLNFLLCLWGMGMNMMRNKRKSDRFRVSLIASAVISLGGLIVFFVFF
jgi:hypothetical protein